MSSVRDANIALLRRAWAAYDRGDEEEFSSCLTPDWKESTGPIWIGPMVQRWRTNAGRCIFTASPSPTSVIVITEGPGIEQALQFAHPPVYTRRWACR